MIPKVIHYCWFGNGELPEKDRACVESWKKYCPDWDIIRWDESNYDVRKNPYMSQAYDAKRWGFVPDYGRLDIIYHNGGIYLDTDVELLTSLDDLLSYSGYAGFGRNGYVNLGLGFGAESHNDVIGHLLKAYDDIQFINHDGTLNLTASPHYSSSSLEELGFTINNEFQDIDGFALLPHDWLDALDEGTGRIVATANTHSIHRYFGSWLDPQVKMQKELRRSLNACHVPDKVAFPASRCISYVRHHGITKAVKRAFKGPAANGQGD